MWGLAGVHGISYRVALAPETGLVLGLGSASSWITGNLVTWLVRVLGACLRACVSVGVFVRVLYPFLLLNTKIHSSPVCSRKKQRCAPDTMLKYFNFTLQPTPYATVQVAWCIPSYEFTKYWANSPLHFFFWWNEPSVCEVDSLLLMQHKAAWLHEKWLEVNVWERTLSEIFREEWEHGA